MNQLSFFIHGTPAPGGSKSAIPIWTKGGKLIIKMINGREWPIFNMIDAGGERNKEWKKAVAIQAKAFMREAPPFASALKCELIFYMRRPQNHFGTGRNEGILKPNAPIYHTPKRGPDALKLARSTEDAMTGIVWVDDSLTVRICSERKFCGPEDKEGCAVRIILLPSPPELFSDAT